MHSIKQLIRKTVSLLPLCILLTCGAMAQNITARLIDLPGSFNRDLLCMSRDDEGFIWFSNNEGLWRFDGTDVKLFDYKKLNLPQNTAASNLWCYRQFIFFNTQNNMQVYNKVTGECNAYNLQDAVYNIDTTNAAKLLFITGNGQAWKFTAVNGLQKTFNLSSFAGWQKDMQVQKMLVDTGGATYICIRGRVGVLGENSIRWGPVENFDTVKGRGPFITVYSAALTSRCLAVNYYNGQLIIYDKHTLSPLYEYFGEETAYCIAVNDKLVVIPHDTVGNYPRCPLIQVTACLSSELLKVRSMVFIKASRTFLAATNIGIIELTPKSSSPGMDGNRAKQLAFFSNKSVRSIYRLHNNLYVGTYTGFYESTPDSIHKITTLVVYAIRQLSDSVLLVSTEGGVGGGLYNTRSHRYTYFPKNADHTFYVYSLYKDGNQWLGGSNGKLLSLQQNGVWNIQPVFTDSSLGIVRQVKRINGKLFIAGQNGVYISDDKKRLQKIYPARDKLRVYCMQETGDGIWLGTHGDGLVKIDATGKVLQQVGFNDGLAGNFVYSLTTMGNLLVAGTSNGLSVFNMANGIQPLEVNNADSLKGISTEECNHSALFYDSALQQVILGGVKGLIFVDGKDYINNAAASSSRLILSYIKKGGHETISAQADLFAYASGDIILKPADVYVTLKFASPGGTGPAEGLFRIWGLDDKWQRIKINQEVNLYALPPGTYTLQARLPTAASSSEWFTKTIVVLPAFYQTIFFKMLLVAGFLGAVYVFWRSKVKKIERELLLRSTIASDLHDDIGSTLNSISVYTEIAGQQLHRDVAKAQVLLEKMGTASRGMIDTMSDIVWAVNPKNDDFENVLQRMQFFAGELLSGKNILLAFEADDKVKKLKFTMQQRKNIYLIYKEAVNNIYKYSGATSVAATVIKEGGHLVMALTDNGKGFDVQAKTNSGNGLANMQKRAKEIGGKLLIKSAKEEGTFVQLRVRLQ